MNQGANRAQAVLTANQGSDSGADARLIHERDVVVDSTGVVADLSFSERKHYYILIVTMQLYELVATQVRSLSIEFIYVKNELNFKALISL